MSAENGHDGSGVAPMTDVPAVETQDLTKLYQQGSNVVQALRGVSISLEPGEFAAVVGRPGSGKTTLLDIIRPLLHPPAGRCRWTGPTRVGCRSGSALGSAARRSGSSSTSTTCSPR